MSAFDDRDDNPSAHLDDHLASTLDVLDAAHNYTDWIIDLVRPYLEGPIIEVGAGHGTFTDRLAAVGPVLAVEPGRTGSAVLEARFGQHPHVEVAQQLVEELPDRATFGSAVMINVLEHIEDDRATVEQLHRRLLPGGHLGVWVPAFEFLYSEFDRGLGHVRRYRRPQLVELMESVGFTIVDARYVNLPGWFSWLVVNRLCGATAPSERLVAVFDRVLVPLTRWAEGWVRVPFGQSVLVVGRKPVRGELGAAHDVA